MYTYYASKPVTRKAHLITPEDSITKVEEKETTYLIVVSPHNNTEFRAYTIPEVGDYVVYLKDDHIYHCPAKVFEARNIIPIQIPK